MSTASTLAVIALLEQLLTRAMSIGVLLRQAQSEGREITDLELSQLRKEDDAARSALEEAIAAARARQRG